MDAIKFEVLTPERIASPPADAHSGPRTEANTHVSTPESIKKEQSILELNDLPTVKSNEQENKPSVSIEFASNDSLGIEPESQEPSSRLIASIIKYGDLNLRDILKFAQVCKAARQIATSDPVIEPILMQVGVRRQAKEEKTGGETLVSFSSELSPCNILDRPYSGPAFLHLEQIFAILAPYAKRPELIASRFASSTSDQVKVLNNARSLATLIGQATWLNALDLQQNKEMLELLDGVRKSLEIRDSTSLAKLTHSLESLGFDAQDMVDLGIESNRALTSSLLSIDFVAKPEVETEERDVSVDILDAALAQLSAGLSRAKADIQSFPRSWQQLATDKTVEVVILRLNEFFDDTISGYDTQTTDIPSETDVARGYVTLVTLRKWLDQEEKDGISSETIGKLRDQVYARLQEHFLEIQSQYLTEYGRKKMAEWAEKVADNEQAKESFIWSSLPQSSEKKSFLTSFMWSFGSSKEEEPSTPKQTSTEVLDVTPSDSVRSATTPRTVSGTVPTPQTKLEAQTAVLIAKLQNIESLVSMPLVLDLLDTGRKGVNQARDVGAGPAYQEKLFVALLELIDRQHIQPAFDKAISTLNDYDPKTYGRLIVQDVEDGSSVAVEPLAIFAELVNVGDLVQQLVHVFFEKELVAHKVVRKTDFAKPSVKAKRRFEQVLDDRLAEGLSRGIDVLMDQVEFVLNTEQLGSDYCPIPGMGPPSLGPTAAAEKVIDLVRSHLNLLSDSTEKNLFDVFQQEVGLRLYHAITRHIKLQTINLDGAVTLLGDINYYYKFAASLQRRPLTAYYEALKQIGQLYLIDTADARQLGVAAADITRFKGVMSSEELVEFLRRRQDWPLVRSKVESVLYGMTECTLM